MARKVDSRIIKTRKALKVCMNWFLKEAMMISAFRTSLIKLILAELLLFTL